MGDIWTGVRTILDKEIRGARNNLQQAKFGWNLKYYIIDNVLFMGKFKDDLICRFIISTTYNRGLVTDLFWQMISLKDKFQ